MEEVRFGHALQERGMLQQERAVAGIASDDFKAVGAYVAQGHVGVQILRQQLLRLLQRLHAGGDLLFPLGKKRGRRVIVAPDAILDFF